jgi:hypothetical protein
VVTESGGFVRLRKGSQHYLRRALVHLKNGRLLKRLNVRRLSFMKSITFINGVVGIWRSFLGYHHH